MCIAHPIFPLARPGFVHGLAPIPNVDPNIAPRFAVNLLADNASKLSGRI
jgi:hypothetical protein